MRCLPVYPQGYDATSHFETEIHDVMDLYRRITGVLLACVASLCVLNQRCLAKKKHAVGQRTADVMDLHRRNTGESEGRLARQTGGLKQPDV